MTFVLERFTRDRSHSYLRHWLLVMGRNLSDELNVLAKRLSGTVPANVANFTRFIVARLSGDQTTVDNPDTAIAIAIANGDFDEARRLINKLEDEAKRKALLQTLARAEFKSRLNEADLSEALNIARKIDNPNLRALALSASGKGRI